MGAAVGLYFAVKLLSGVARGAPDALPDHLAAALATGAACGLLGAPALRPGLRLLLLWKAQVLQAQKACQEVLSRQIP